MLVQSSPVAAPERALGRPRKQHGRRALATHLREHGVFSSAHAADLALDVCDALALAHANGVVHGQLGLRCVRLTMTREAGPRDVDIFTLTEDDDGPIALQSAPFLAPEQRDLARSIDSRADIWALGALLYTVLIGLAPPAGGPAAVCVPSEGMPSSLASLVESCLATDPALRPQDVDELTEKIASFATWPPDRFARLAERRDRRASAERARMALAARGLQNMPHVLDKLDEAAFARAQRDDAPATAAMSSILDRPTSKAAMDRLMAVVHEGTEAARVELAAELPALLDFDDEDEVLLPTRVDEEPVSLAPVECPLTTAPMFLVAAQAGLPLLTAPAPREEAPRQVVRIAGLAVTALALSLSVGYLGYRMTAATPAGPSTRAAQPPAAAPASIPLFAPSALPEVAVPLFVPSALPEVAPVTPASLPDAKAIR